MSNIGYKINCALWEYIEYMKYILYPPVLVHLHLYRYFRLPFALCLYKTCAYLGSIFSA